MTLTAYAQRRGVSAKAVSKAVASGRLIGSVVRDARGAPKIGNAELADLEWTANTRHRADRQGNPSQEGDASAPAHPVACITRTSPPAEHAAATTSGYQASRALREAAAARRETAQAELAELELAERRGELISADEARAGVLEAFSLAKTRMLGIPSRVGQRLAHLADEVVPVVDELVREALEELAGRAGATGR